MKNLNTREFVIVDPSYSESRQGHYNAYDDGIRLEAGKFHRVKLLGAISNESRDESELNLEESSVIPTFSLDIWGQSNLGLKDFGLRSSQSKKILLADFEKSMSVLQFHEPTVFFFPNFTETQIGIITRLNEQFNHFEVMLVLRYQIEISPIAELAALREQYQENGNFLTILTDSSELLTQVNIVSEGMIESVLPVPHGMKYKMNRYFEKREKTRFIHLGNPRIEKGFQEITEAILEQKNRSGCEFIIQVSNPERELDLLIQEFIKEKKTNVNIISKVLSKEDYSNLLSSSDCTLAPYQPSIYAHRTSSVISESQALGVPVIATAGTVGGELVRASGAGIVISELTTEKIGEAILDASKRIPELTLKASIQKSMIFNSGTFFQLWQAIMANSNILRRKKVVIFYPWSFQDVRYSGAGNRLISTIRNLHKLGIEVTVFNGLGVRHRRYLDVDFIPMQLNMDMQQDSNLALHKSNLELDANLELAKCLQRVDLVVFEGTHLVNCLEKSLVEHHLDDVYVVSHDVIKTLDNQNAKELFSLQEKALAKYKSHSLSKDEIKIWLEQGIQVSFTKPTDLDDFSRNSELSRSLAEGLINHTIKENDKVLLFVGGSYWPNVEAAEFAKEFIKLLRISQPCFKLLIIGSVCEVISSESWVSVGKVSREILDAFYERASVIFIPMFHGTGVSIKTIEALKKNKPVFTTQIGIRGLSTLEKSSCYVSNIVTPNVNEMVEEFVNAYFGDSFPVVTITEDMPDDFIDAIGKSFSNPHRINPSIISVIQDLSNTQITQTYIEEIVSSAHGDEFELQIKYLLCFYAFKSGVQKKSILLDLLSDGTLSKFGGSVPEAFLDKDTGRLILSSLHYKLLNDSHYYIDDEDLETWYNFLNEFAELSADHPIENPKRIFTLYTYALRIQKYWIVRRLLSSQIFLNSRLMETYRRWKHRPLELPKRPW